MASVLHPLSSMAKIAEHQDKYVQGLVADGRVEVPGDFLVGSEERAVSEDGLFQELPLVDLSALENGDDASREEAKANIAAACKEWGFFQVVNHGIPTEVVETARRVAREFFELPVEEKLKWARKEGHRDQVAGYGRTDGFRGKATDWMDSLYAFLAPSSLKARHLWPSTPPHYRESIETFGEESDKLLKRLLSVISENLGMEKDGLEKEFVDFSLFYRANYYPPCPQPEKVLGTHSHTDHGAITILVQDDICDGLQVRKDGRWVAVAPLPNALVINLGECIKGITKGMYKSAEHRGVVTNKTTAMTLVVHLDPPLSH
eukprot:Gb_19147 [translate_table: standard]